MRNEEFWWWWFGFVIGDFCLLREKAADRSMSGANENGLPLAERASMSFASRASNHFLC